MDYKTAFSVLGIEMTKEKDNIRQAYRRLLVKNNPEDNPEGFKSLREAYETASAYADIPEQGMEEEAVQDNEANQWLEKVKAVYGNLKQRINSECWRELLREDVCLSLDSAEEVRRLLFGFLMTHFRLPPQVWKLLDEHFLISEEEAVFKEQFPAEFVDYMLGQLRGRVHFPYEYFEGPEDGDYDAWITEYFKLYETVEQEEYEKAKEILERMNRTGIRHPLAGMEQARLLLAEGRREEAVEEAVRLLEQCPGELRILALGGSVLWRAEEQERAASVCREILERLPDHFISNLHLALYHSQRQEYKKAKTYLDAAGRINHEDALFKETLAEVNNHLIAECEGKISQGSAVTEDYILLGWCFLQNKEPEAGIGVLTRREEEPEPEQRAAWHSLLERLYYGAGYPDKTEEEGNAWIESIRMEEPGLSDNERKHVPRRIAAAYYYMGLAWMQTKQHDERALKFLDSSAAFFENDMDVQIKRAEVLGRLGRYKESAAVCDKVLIQEPDNFLGYIYRMDAYVHLKNGQGAIDDFYRAKDIFPGYAPIYDWAAKVFDQHGQYKDVLDVAKQAAEQEIDSPRLSFYRLKALGRLAETRGEVEKMAAGAEKLLDKLAQETAENHSVLRGELQAELARAKATLDDMQAALCHIRQAKALDNRPYYWWLEGRFLMDLGEYEEALKILLHCENDFPDQDQIPIRIGECFAALGKRAKAVQYYERALEINPDSETADYKLASLYRELLSATENMKFYEKGLFHADRQLERMPEAYYYIERGLLHQEAGCYQKAMDDYKKALESEPENVYAHNNLCICLRILGRYEEAIRAGRRGEYYLKEDDSAGVYASLGDCYQDIRDYENALDCYLKHQARFPKASQSMKKLIKVNMRLGRKEEAFYWIEKQCGDEKEIMQLYKAMVSLYLNEMQTALDSLAGLMNCRSISCIARLQAAKIYYYYTGKHREAGRLAKKAWQESVGGSKEYFVAGLLLEEIYYRRGRKRRAAMLADKLREQWEEKWGSLSEVLRKNKDRGRSLTALGLISVYSGNMAEGKRLLKLLEDAPHCYKCSFSVCWEGTCKEGPCTCLLFFRGLILEAESRKEEALTCFRASLESYPESMSAAFGIRRLEH